jgi:hypothetical protein
VTAFLLTLRRKFHTLSNVVTYGLLLVGGFGLGVYESCIVVHRHACDAATLPPALALVACTAALWRMGVLFPSFPFCKHDINGWIRNKYLIWTIEYGVLQRFLRPILRKMTIARDASNSSALEDVVYELIHRRHRRSQVLVPGLGWMAFVITLSYGVYKGLAKTIKRGNIRGL